MAMSTLAATTARDAPPAASQLVALRDGTPLLVRGIATTDGTLLAAAYERLSDDSRRRRFLSASSPTARDLAYFTKVDHHGHEAMVAIDPASGTLVGAAHDVRVPGTDGDAELSVEVVGAWQRRGVATALLAALPGRARREGVRRFVAIVSEENRPVIDSARARRRQALPNRRRARLRHRDPGHRHAAPPAPAGARAAASIDQRE